MNIFEGNTEMPDASMRTLQILEDRIDELVVELRNLRNDLSEVAGEVIKLKTELKLDRPTPKEQ